MSSGEIKSFQDFLDKINSLPTNAAYAKKSSGSTSVKNSSISGPPVKPVNLTLTLKPIRGDPQLLRVRFTETVGALREKVAAIFSIDEVERCRLIRGGKALSDDSQNLESVFGLVSEVQILHVLEKPPLTNTNINTNTTSTSSINVGDWKSNENHQIWSKIDQILQSEISSPQERVEIIKKFRKSLA